MPVVVSKPPQTPLAAIGFSPQLSHPISVSYGLDDEAFGYLKHFVMSPPLYCSISSRETKARFVLAGTGRA